MSRILKSALVLLTAVSFISCDDSGITQNNVNSSWLKTYGGTNADQITSAQGTSDGGQIISGYTVSSTFGDNDIFAAKTDIDGNLVWSNYYGSTLNDQASSIIPTTDGGYVICGQTNSFGALNFDLYVIKMNSGGSVTWSKIYKAVNNEFGAGIQQTSDGGYLVAGTSNSFSSPPTNDVILLKLGSGGNLEWAKTYGGTQNDYASSLKKTPGGFIIAGSTYSFSALQSDVMLVNLNSSESVIWSRIYGGESDDKALCVESSGNDFLVCGYTSSFALTNEDMFIFKTDNNGFAYNNSNGHPRTFGGQSMQSDKAYSIIPTSDGGIIITGYTGISSNNQDVAVVKLFGNLEFSWAKLYGGTNNDGGAFINANSSGYSIFGFTYSYGTGSSDICNLRIKSDGSTCSNVTDYTPNGGTPTIFESAVTLTISSATLQETDVTTSIVSGGFSAITVCENH